MAEPAARRVPWGQVLTTGLVALLPVLVYRAASGRDHAAPWPVALSAGAVAVGAFLVLRRLQNAFWGLVAALALSLHPLRWEWSPPFAQALRGESMELLVLAAVAAGWELTALPRFAWSSWLLVAVAVVVAGGLAWPASPQAGLVAALLVAIGLPLGALLTALRHRARPARANLACAALLGVAGPVLGLLLAGVSVRALDWPVSPEVGTDSGPLDFLAAAVGPEPAGLSAPAYARQHLHRWAWPAVWAILPLMAVGLWCAARRGLRQFASRRPPVPWILVLYAFAALLGLVLHPRGRLEKMLPLAALALLLAVFGVAELARALTRPLVLPPPGERTEEERG